PRQQERAVAQQPGARHRDPGAPADRLAGGGLGDRGGPGGVVRERCRCRGGVLMPALRQLDAIGPDGPYRAQHRQAISYLGGAPAAQMSMVPILYAIRAIKELRAAPRLSRGQRLDALRAAAREFAHGCVAGMSAPDYQRTVSRVTGTPIT